MSHGVSRPLCVSVLFLPPSFRVRTPFSASCVHGLTSVSYNLTNCNCGPDALPILATRSAAAVRNIEAGFPRRRFAPAGRLSPGPNIANITCLHFYQFRHDIAADGETVRKTHPSGPYPNRNCMDRKNYVTVRDRHRKIKWVQH